MTPTTSLDLDPTVQDRIEKLAPLETDVLITGPTGTGKSTVAQRIHDLGGRKGRFIPQNCAAIPAELAESVLFGHKRGAFTGALRDEPGVLMAADGGTLFLDEIGELPLAIQAKLLTVLQDHQVQRLGAVDARPSRFRLIAATHRDLLERCNQGLFREDLYHRINGLRIAIPPLRETSELAERIAAKEARRLGLPADIVARLLPTVRELTNHPMAWPGNIRELLKFVGLCQVGVDDAKRRALDEWPRWRRSEGTERLTPFAPAVSPSLSDRERFAGVIQGLAGEGLRPKLAFSRRGSMALASRLLDVYPGPLSTEEVQTLLRAVDRRTTKKNIEMLVTHGLVQRAEDGIVAWWPPASSTLFVRRASEWVPVGRDELPSLAHHGRIRIEVTSRCAGVLGIMIFTHSPSGAPSGDVIVRGKKVSASMPTRVEVELDGSGGLEQILVHVCPPRPRGGHLVELSEGAGALPDSVVLDERRRWLLHELGEGWLQEHLVFHLRDR